MTFTRFEPDRYYLTTDPELRLIASRGTLAIWRHENRGPAFTRFGNRILYKGSDLNAWLDSHRVQTAAA